MARLAVTSCQSARIATPSRSAGAAARSQPSAVLGSVASLMGACLEPGLWLLIRDCPIWWRCGWQVARFDGHMPPPADRSQPGAAFPVHKNAALSRESRPSGRRADAGRLPRQYARRRRRFDPLPSGLYRRPRLLTGSASPKGVARGLGVLRAIPPVGNRTLP